MLAAKGAGISAKIPHGGMASVVGGMRSCFSGFFSNLCQLPIPKQRFSGKNPESSCASSENAVKKF